MKDWTEGALAASLAATKKTPKTVVTVMRSVIAPVHKLSTMVHLPFLGECHFVSRRVSESEEREISSGSLSDKVVLMSFWFTVFVLVMAVIITFQRNRRKKRGASKGFDDPSFNFSSSATSSEALLSSRTPTWSKSMKYTPLKLTDDMGGGSAAGELDNSEEIDIDFQDDDEEDEEHEHSLINGMSEGVPLVLKT
ncbi:hypothetical protein Ocin01_08711 [Orchesella cincta]|uniref:Uncharacterized protein n=1 Tax=Orchesella cincta TaxID=48709 RepID=A0A1D2MY40_ORCCI|nr:hypothetical protein Ocin01_08711 [Orchesella cincta]